MGMFGRIGATLALMAFAGSAYAQSTVVQSGPWTSGHVATYTGGGSSQPYVFDSGVANGGAVGYGITELNITQSATVTPDSPYGTPFCINDAPTTGSSGYHQFCLGANSLGGGLISYNAYGDATPDPILFMLNGVEYTFPFTIGGILGPATSVIGDVACWNSTTGSILKDCGVPGGVTPATINELAFYACNACAVIQGLPTADNAVLTTNSIGAPSLTQYVNIPNNASLSVSPTGNPTGGVLLPTYASLNVQGTTISPTNREFLANIGLTSNTGNAATTANNGKVALYAGVTGSAGTGDIWATNFLLTEEAGSGNYAGQVIEVDTNNLNVSRAGSDGPAGYPSVPEVGVSISGAGPYPNTAALALDSFGGNADNQPMFAHAIASNGYYTYNVLADYSESPTYMAIFGGHGYGIDMSQANITTGGIRLSNQVTGGILARNLANTADAKVIRYDGTNIYLCETLCSVINVNGNIFPATDDAYALGIGGHAWSAGFFYQLNVDTGGGTFNINDGGTLGVNGVAAFASSVSIGGTVELNGLGGGTPVKYLCQDASNIVVSSSVGCPSGGGGGGAVASVTAGPTGNLTATPTTGAVIVDLSANPKSLTTLSVGTATSIATITDAGTLSVGSTTSLASQINFAGLTAGTPSNVLCQDTSKNVVSCGGSGARAIPNVFATELTVDTGASTATISDGGSLAVAGLSNLTTLDVNGLASFASAVAFSGSVQFTGLTGGTPAYYACFDSSGLLVRSATAC